MPVKGHMVTMAIAKTTIRMILIGIPCLKNSPVENCFDSYAIAFGAAPISSTNGIPAVTSDE